MDLLELELVDDPAWSEPSDTSYLTDEDRANPDIMANVEAMAATDALIAWFGQDMVGFVGLWRGPDGTPLTEAPVVRLDTEGQYELVAATVGDYIAVSVDEEDFDEARDALLGQGFQVAPSVDAIWASVEPLDCPNDFRHRLYNEARARRGLDPVE